jgi:hypothetical protein
VTAALAVAGRWLAVHRKLVVAVAGSALTVALQVWGPDNPYVSFAVLAATSLGVYRAPNQDAGRAPARQPQAGGTPRRGRGPR